MYGWRLILVRQWLYMDAELHLNNTKSCTNLRQMFVLDMRNATERFGLHRREREVINSKVTVDLFYARRRYMTSWKRLGRLGKIERNVDRMQIMHLSIRKHKIIVKQFEAHSSILKKVYWRKLKWVRRLTGILMLYVSNCATLAATISKTSLSQIGICPYNQYLRIIYVKPHPLGTMFFAVKGSAANTLFAVLSQTGLYYIRRGRLGEGVRWQTVNTAGRTIWLQNTSMATICYLSYTLRWARKGSCSYLGHDLVPFNGLRISRSWSDLFLLFRNAAVHLMV